MSLIDEAAAEIHPIDMVENLALARDWVFDRVAEEQIAMEINGSWRSYTITMALSRFDDSLRLICTFSLTDEGIDLPEERLAEFYELLNLVNDKCWAGGFSFWKEQQMMVYKTGIMIAGTEWVSPEQIDQLLGYAVSAPEQFYPAFQLVLWGNRSPQEAMQTAITEAYGRA